MHTSVTAGSRTDHIAVNCADLQGSVMGHVEFTAYTGRTLQTGQTLTMLPTMCLQMISRSTSALHRAKKLLGSEADMLHCRAQVLVLIASFAAERHHD